MARAALPCPLETLLHSCNALMIFSRFDNITPWVVATAGPQWRAANLTVSCSSGVRWGQHRSKFGMTWTCPPNCPLRNRFFSLPEVVASNHGAPAGLCSLTGFFAAVRSRFALREYFEREAVFKTPLPGLAFDEVLGLILRLRSEPSAKIFAAGDVGHLGRLLPRP
jgi:hypothetical protein